MPTQLLREKIYFPPTPKRCFWENYADKLEKERRNKFDEKEMQEKEIKQRALIEHQAAMELYHKTRQKALVEMREKEKGEERLKKEAQEEAMHKELLRRQQKVPKDDVGEEYFKDKERFKFKDKRDPIYAGLNTENESSDWKSFINEGLKESKETLQKIRDSQPFTVTGPHTEGGRLGFRTVSPGQFVVTALILTFLGLLALELRHQYTVNTSEAEILRQTLQKNNNN